MGQVDLARVDVAAVFAVAQQFDAIADLLEGSARARLSRPMFGGSTAGREHVGPGEAVRSATSELADALRQWARAAGEIAAVLRLSADRYVVADGHAADRVG
ncbi:ESX-1 secretion-associated protein [Mycobacterium sp. TNTM28]|uniref:ESX-1 secretion-associated protein n=1 Tax=[Mycobacterium] fortunisiensis TaxID=2600579 RepID=A0ABS6KJV5_9MYCO|nr:type VII secretion target [[Mycobacterium] fortunisiensis]MBU9763793.1 ESX-1 secretion-associated protein [[Mycobacterium] fortunisiensis]